MTYILSDLMFLM